MRRQPSADVLIEMKQGLERDPCRGGRQMAKELHISPGCTKSLEMSKPLARHADDKEAHSTITNGDNVML